jgi:CRP-like cAMP-binding protein
MSSSSERTRGVLAQSELFRSLSPADIEQLASIGVKKRVASGESVLLRGQAAVQLYAVLSGQVKAVATAPDGREVVLRLIDPGSIFGEIALLDGAGRTATIVATRASELLVIDRRDFLDLLKRRPQIAIELLAVVAHRLRATTDQLGDTSFLQLGSRLAKKLLDLVHTYGEPADGGSRIRVSQEELGNLVAASRVAVNQQLKAWEREGLVRTGRGAVTVLDPDGLEDAAER